MAGLQAYTDRMKKEVKTAEFWRDVIAEGLATFFLVAVQCALPLTWSDTTLQLGNVVQVALGMGFVVTVLIEVFGEMGGAHMNPAVTISMMLTTKVTCLRGKCAYNDHFSFFFSFFL